MIHLVYAFIFEKKNNKILSYLLLFICCIYFSGSKFIMASCLQDIFLQKEILDSLSSSDKDDTEASANGESYAGDSEGSMGMYVSNIIILFCSFVVFAI